MICTIRTQFSTLYLRCFERTPFLTLLKFQEITGLDGTQLEALKGGFEGFDKENTGCINSTQSQMIFKMMGVQVQVSHIFDNLFPCT